VIRSDWIHPLGSRRWGWDSHSDRPLEVGVVAAVVVAGAARIVLADSAIAASAAAVAVDASVVVVVVVVAAAAVHYSRTACFAAVGSGYPRLFDEEPDDVLARRCSALFNLSKRVVVPCLVFIACPLCMSDHDGES